MRRNPDKLTPLPIGLITPSDEAEALIADRAGEEYTRMITLAEGLGVDTRGVVDWYAVALELARKHEPRLQVTPVPYRKWKEFERMLLGGEVLRLMDEEGLSKIQACRELAGREPWKSFIESKGGIAPDPGETLKAQFNEKFAKTGYNAYLSYRDQDQLDEWERQLSQIE